MPVDKALYQAPQGLEAIVGAEPDIEIEIEDPESVTIGVDGMEIEIEPEKESEDDFNANLAEEMDEGEMQSIVGELLDAHVARQARGQLGDAGARTLHVQRDAAADQRRPFDHRIADRICANAIALEECRFERKQRKHRVDVARHLACAIGPRGPDLRRRVIRRLDCRVCYLNDSLETNRYDGECRHRRVCTLGSGSSLVGIF